MITMVKINKTYSLNMVVIQELEKEFPDLNKSRLLEALIIEYLMKYDRESNLPTKMVEVSNVLPQEIT